MLLALAGGCGSKDPDPPPTAAHATIVETKVHTCATMVPNLTAIARKEMSRSPEGKDMLSLLPKIGELTQARCTTDRWSQQAIDCMATARRPGDTEKCESLLTDEQREAMSRDMKTLAPPAR